MGATGHVRRLCRRAELPDWRESAPIAQQGPAPKTVPDQTAAKKGDEHGQNDSICQAKKIRGHC